MPQGNIAIVEDEHAIARLLQINLEALDYRVTTFGNGEDFLAALNNTWPDVLILDLMLPGIDGLEICRRIRQGKQNSQLPILMLTAKGEEIDRVLGLELGADDYMTKPFSVRELAARVKSLLRRCRLTAPTVPATLTCGNIVLEQQSCRVLCQGQELDLSKKEFQVLAALLEHPGWVMTRENLLTKIWGYEYTGETRTLDVHMGNLRHKLEAAGAIGCTIETVRGMGYRIKADGVTS
jgi:two-component system alkaline phosphatase synthesis response regulator PhoP